MRDGSSRPGRAIVLFAVACVLAATVAPAAAAGAIEANSAGSEVDGVAGAGEAVDADRADSAAVSIDDETVHSGSIGPGLQSTNGTVEVIVRFEGAAEVDTQGTTDDESIASDGSETLSTSELKTNAASAQGDFERFAERKPGVTVERSFWLANAMLVTIDTESVAVERLLDVRGVERVHENFEVKLDSAAATGGAATSVGGPPVTDTASTTATSTNATYGVDMVRAPAVWEEFDTRGEGATVAVLDTGIDPDHPDLNVSGWAEYDSDGNLVSEGPENAYDDGEDGHGTHVAGTVAGDNASGTAIGVAPGAELYGIKVLGSDGSGNFGQVVAGMEYATENENVDVLQMSLGANDYISDFIEPVRNSRDAGKIVVASSGNSGQGTSSSPGNIYDSFAVGAVDSSRTVSGTSSGENVTTADDWGSDAPSDWPAEYVVPDASAPGVDVNSSLPSGGYGLKSGTSMAAPHASGVAALVISSTSRNVSDDQLYDAIKSTANHPDNVTEPDTRYGTGIVDAYAAVSSTEPFYDVTDLDSPPIAERNATIDATANVTNVDPIPGKNRTVELRLTDPANESDMRALDAANLSLGAGNTTTVRLNGTVPSDFGTGETTVSVATPEETANATVRIADSVGSVSGTVTDAETNATLPDIDVVVRNGTEAVGEATTDENGTYDIDVPATNLTVTASNATYAPANETVELNGSGDATTANLSLALRNGTLAGFVNATDDLGVSANATITVTNETNTTVATVDATENNSYAVGLRPGSYNVTAAATDFHSDDRTGVVIGPNATTDPKFELAPRAATLSGTVTNESSGDPIVDATVTAGSASTDTGTAGNYSLAVDRGNRTVRTSATGYVESSRDLTLSANESREENVSLTPTAVFEVTSISGPDEIEQGSSGEFTIEIRNEGRVAGNVTVSAAVSPSGTIDPASQSFSDVEVDATRSSTFSVSVADSASATRYDFTASIEENGDDSQTLSFDVLDGADDDTEDTNTGGGGAAGPTTSDDDEETTEPTDETDDSTNQTDNPTNETDSPTNETDGPTNETDGPTNETDGPTNETDDPTNETDGPTDEPTDDADGSNESDDATESDGVEGDETGDTAASNDDSSDDEAPGFGVIAGVVALLSAALVAQVRGGTG